jgi:hypothetical protein
MGEMSSEATHPSVTTAGMTREVRVAHRKFPDGGLVIPSLPDVRKTANAQIVRTAFMLALRRPDVSLQAARQWAEDRAARKAPLPPRAACPCIVSQARALTVLEASRPNFQGHVEDRGDDSFPDESAKRSASRRTNSGERRRVVGERNIRAGTRTQVAATFRWGDRPGGTRSWPAAISSPICDISERSNDARDVSRPAGVDVKRT